MILKLLFCLYLEKKNSYRNFTNFYMGFSFILLKILKYRN